MCKTGCTDEQDNNRSHVAAEEDGFLRGIEMLIYPQRSQNKLIARRALIKYQTYLQTQRTDITAEQKASAMRTASEKLSKWSHLVAQETARLDSLRAYDAEYLIPLDDQRVEFSTSPEHMFKKTRPFKKARTAMTATKWWALRKKDAIVDMTSYRVNVCSHTKQCHRSSSIMLSNRNIPANEN
eukprot:scaffold7268_cov159-Skeletonema_menzelii.AAC.2